MKSDFIKIVIIGGLIGVLLFIIDVSYNYNFKDALQLDRTMAIQLGYYLFYSVVLTLVNSYYFNYVGSLSWANSGMYQLLLRVFGSIFLTVLVVIILRAFEKMAINGSNLTEFYSNELKNKTFYLNVIRFTMIISVVFHVFYYYNELQKKKVTEQKVIAGTASAQFDALKNQLDPHFLFNSLNVLTSLIDENPDAAQDFTTSLSKVYRYVLEQKSKELVSVEEELQFAKTYMTLLKMRFEDSIVFEFPQTVTNPEAKVVPLSLQLLLENAVKHNTVTAAKPLRIRIFEEAGSLVVENNLQPKEVVKKSSGLGLENIQQRYALLTHRLVTIKKNRDSFKVGLPMLTKQLSVMKAQENYIEDKRYLRAKERVEKIRGFYSNLLSFMIVIPILAYVNYRTTSFPWVIFPIIGWGTGLIAHGLGAYGINPILGKDWEEKKIRDLMNREQ
ncbi:MAG: histidine kinase [Flavobacteriaceae bacterium]|nr:histidine kinase [Flavobacteriaceae bacterium]